MDEQEEIEESPENLTRELIEEKLKEAQERLEKYLGYQKLMEESGASQLSLTDADAKLMKNKNEMCIRDRTPTAPTGSSTFNTLSINSIPNTTIKPAAIPIIAADVGDTVSHPAVIATRPARDPFRDMDTSGFL